VRAITPSGSITLRASGPDVVGEGTAVADPRTGVRGVVTRVFGPVAQPYVSVRPRRAPTPAEGVRLIGSTLVAE
jgi:rRNA processing protein Gar1